MTTFHEFLCTGADTFGDRPAILFEDSCLSHAELLVRVERVAAGFQAHGIGAGDTVALLMDNSLECILAWLALSAIGCTDVPINPHYRGHILTYLLENSQATAAICDSQYLPDLADIAASLPGLRSVIVNGLHQDAPVRWRLATLEACAASGSGFVPARESAERVILYSSGTTGPSKGVIHSQKSCLVLSRYNAEVMGYGPGDRLLNFFPLFHQNARYTGVIPALSAGASIRMERRLSTSSFWQTCDSDGITAFNYLGSVLRMILNVTPPQRDKASHSLRKAFGAGATAAVAEEFEQRLGIALIEVYGLTEAPMATVNRRHLSPPGSARPRQRAFRRSGGRCRRQSSAPRHDRRTRDPAQAAGRHDAGLPQQGCGDGLRLPQPLVPLGRPGPLVRIGRPLFRGAAEGFDPPPRREHFRLGSGERAGPA